MEKLQVGREEGKKGSLKAVVWDDAGRLAFENLKMALKEGLEVFQIEPDHPLFLRTDASDFALAQSSSNKGRTNGFQLRFTVENLPKV